MVTMKSESILSPHKSRNKLTKKFEKFLTEIDQPLKKAPKNNIVNPRGSLMTNLDIKLSQLKEKRSSRLVSVDRAFS